MFKHPWIPLMVVVSVSALCTKSYTEPVKDLPTESSYEYVHLKKIVAQVSTTNTWASFEHGSAAISLAPPLADK